jgi:hypothetical protein
VSGLRRVAPPPRARLLAGLGALLPSLPEPLYLVAEQVVGLEGEIDAVARDGRGRAVVVRVAEPGEDLAAFTDLLAQRDWLEPRIRDWLKLSPGLGLRPELGVAGLLLAGDFDVRTVAAARSIREGDLRLARLQAFEWQGTLQLVIEPATPGSRPEPARLRDLDLPTPTQHDDDANGNGNGRHAAHSEVPHGHEPRTSLIELGPQTAALESRFRTGLSDEELGLPRRPRSAPR